MREAGDVCFADVFKDGSGVCEYVRYEDMKYALKKLDDSKFRSHEVSFSLTQSITIFDRKLSLLRIKDYENWISRGNLAT